MIYRPLGPSGIEASAAVLGTWAIGGWLWGGTDEKESIEAIHAAMDAGVNAFDTAPIYGFGYAEDVVAKALKGRRDKAIIATKCGLVCDTSAGVLHFKSDSMGMNPNGLIRAHIYLDPKSIRRELEGSLARLQTDYIDLYQTHWQEPTTPIADTMAELLKMKEEGKIRAIGASNATAAQLGKYAAVGQLDTDQEKFSMIDRKIEKDQLPYCRKHNAAVLAYSPLANGLLTGKLGPDREFGPGDIRAGNPRFSVDSRKRIMALLDKFRDIREQRRITQAQLTIAWTLHQPGVTHALFGARNAPQAAENAAAGAVELSAEELAAMNAAIAEYRAANAAS